MGGYKSNEGRLEVKIRGIWGTVCNKGWTKTSSDTICHMLGYKRAIQTTFGIQYNNTSENQPIWLDQVQCIGNEVTIIDCSHGPIGNHLCSHSHDIGMECSSN